MNLTSTTNTIEKGEKIKGKNKNYQIRYEFKSLHGFRKFFKTQCEKAGMRSINIELLMGHNIGLGNSYYKPNETELFQDYLEALIF